MAEGFFVVRQDDKNPHDIVFETKPGAGQPPEDQLALKSDVERTLVVLQMLFENDEKKFLQAFHPLLSLAQCGLVGPSAQPQVAKLALIELQKEVTAREAGNVKNQYLRTLGVRATLFGGPAVVLAILIYYWQGSNLVSSFLALWAGCMAGVWLSFGSRKTFMAFEDLNIPESDRLEPSIRLIFAGLLTMILGLLFVKQAIVVTVGSVATSALAHDCLVAIIVGCLAGFSELALPSKVAKQAALFLDQK
jgi:predicted small lipoprotein YifL